MALNNRNPLIAVVAIGLLSAIFGGDSLTSVSGEETSPVRLDSQKRAQADSGVKRDGPQTVRLQVRVVDTSGRPVPQAVVTVIVVSDEREFETERVMFDGKAELAVDADGRLLTPPLTVDKAYILQIDAPGMLSGLSRWSRTPEQGTVKLPEVVLRRLLTVSGTVVDRQN
jgi:hypothetical protein